MGQGFKSSLELPIVAKYTEDNVCEVILHLFPNFQIGIKIPGGKRNGCLFQ